MEEEEEKNKSFGVRSKFLRKLQEFEVPSRKYPDVPSGQTFVLSGFCSSCLTYRQLS